MEFLFNTFGSLVQNYQDGLIQSRAATYSDCAHKTGASLESCVGFIDETSKYIARPRGTAQLVTYSGHKRHNALEFQAISLPDGPIFHLSGPVEGRRHDMTLFRRSNVAEDLERGLFISNRQFNIYGDPAYVLRPYLQVGLKPSQLSPEQLEFNKHMSSCRVAVKKGFQGHKEVFHACGYAP